jgi:cation transport protein ChaC
MSEPATRLQLTREFLLQAGFADIARRALPGMHVLTDAERGVSLRAILDSRPEQGDGLWLFAYGSLIWNPTFNFQERRVAAIAGWHRAFCLKTRGGRGTAENPALLLGLMPGGCCTGAVFRVGEAELEHELDLVWRREMVTAAYIPRWEVVADAAGRPFGQAIAFTINPDSPAYAGQLAEDEVVRRIAVASGPMGSCAEYLLNTRDGLRGLGIADPPIEAIARQVEAAIGEVARG